jgi:hypothetical protein
MVSTLLVQHQGSTLIQYMWQFSAFKIYYCESNDSCVYSLVKITEFAMHTMENINRIALKVPSLRPLVLLVIGVFKVKISVD